MNREDFPILKKDLIYFDNAATTLKPKIVIDAMTDYYYNYGANINRGDYKISHKASDAYEEVREKVKDFINAKSSKEIIFTQGATDSLNKIIFGFMANYLTKNDEVLITKSEHASLVLPWQILKDKIGIKIKYIPLDDNHELTLTSLEKTITKNTKVISLAHVTNVVGDERPINEISKLAHKNNIILLVDGSQSVPHMKTDVIKDDIDFLVFSSHKMLGPTGLGILYGKEKYLNLMTPLEYGGGMNQYFEANGKYELKSIPIRFEAGTPPIAEVIGFGKAIDYLKKIGMDKIHAYEQDLKKYLVSKLKENKKIILYNKNTKSGILAFNIDGIFSQDTAIYLDHYNICLRAGNHCAKVLKDEINIKNTCRISLYFYNTKEEIDKLVEALNNSDKIFEVIL